MYKAHQLLLLLSLFACYPNAPLISGFVPTVVPPGLASRRRHLVYKPLHNDKMKSRRHLLHAATTDDETPYNVVLTHCTADFDSLASAVGLAKLWSTERKSVPTTLVVDDVDEENPNTEQPDHYSTPDTFNPTYVVLPRGAHPGVAKFLSLHKHLFPIKSLRDLPNPENLDKLGLVDAQRRER